MISHEILDLTIDEERKEEEERILKEDKAEYKTETAKLIVNILETFDVNLGIATNPYYPNIVRIVTELIDKKLSIVKITNYTVENIKEISLQIGNLFANSILEVLILAELGNVDPFGQDAVEKQKNFLK